MIRAKDEQRIRPTAAFDQSSAQRGAPHQKIDSEPLAHTLASAARDPRREDRLSAPAGHDVFFPTRMHPYAAEDHDSFMYHNRTSMLQHSTSVARTLFLRPSERKKAPHRVGRAKGLSPLIRRPWVAAVAAAAGRSVG